MAYGDFKDLSRRTASDKILHDKAFNIVKNKEYDEYHCRPSSVVCNFFDKKSSCANSSSCAIESKIILLENYSQL